MSGLLKLVLLFGLLNFGNALTYKGADISSAKVVENSGISYKDVNGNAGALETILKNNGMNTARIRIWTAGTYNTAYGLALAKVSPILFTVHMFHTHFACQRVKAAGLTLMVDLHYSDSKPYDYFSFFDTYIQIAWADPGHQSIPAGWGTSVASLNTAMLVAPPRLLLSLTHLNRNL